MKKRIKRADDTPLDGQFPFTYEEFEDWYTELTNGLLEPARRTFQRLLNETLDNELSDVDRLRLRISNSRIKSPSRLWHKMLSDRYVGKINRLDDIPNIIDDLVGVRVTCNNLVDVEVFRDIVISMTPVDFDEVTAGLCIDPESERNHSKESGYRAYHINLHTLIQGRNDWKHARGELQVRTLLQDSWGELTHEDTYKPGSPMPKLITKLARRMADLLATVDDLAQDLRNELEDLAQSDLGASDVNGGGAATDAPIVAAQNQADPATEKVANVREALIAETRTVIDALTKPSPLAQVAWLVQANFGREVTTDWGGYGSFKELVRAAVPNAQVIDVPPGTLVPHGIDYELPDAGKPEGAPSAGRAPDGVPAAIQRLKRRDAGAPAVSSSRLGILLNLVVDALDREVWESHGLSADRVGLRELTVLTNHIRSRTDITDMPPRSSVDYTLKSLHFSRNLRPGLGKEEVAAILEDWFFERASKFGFVSDPGSDRAELSDWFRSAVEAT